MVLSTTRPIHRWNRYKAGCCLSRKSHHEPNSHGLWIRSEERAFSQICSKSVLTFREGNLVFLSHVNFYRINWINRWILKFIFVCFFWSTTNFGVVKNLSTRQFNTVISTKSICWVQQKKATPRKIIEYLNWTQIADNKPFVRRLYN